MTVKEAGAKVQRLRDSCKGSALQVTCFAMLDPDFLRDTQLIMFSTEPFRTMHSHWMHELRSIDETLNFHLDMVRREGRFWEAVKKCFLPFGRLLELQRMQFIVTLDGGVIRNTCRNDPVYLEQAMLATEMWG